MELRKVLVRSAEKPRDVALGSGILTADPDEALSTECDIVIEVIEYEAPTTYGWVEIIRRRGSKTFFKLQFAGGATHITMKYVWIPATWRAWFLGQFFRRRNAHRTFDGLLQNLRKALTR